ncbi:hypothetical protein BT63DRAFT_450023 [Microthyrium microscopicum]|uniref:Uncharacterized protein n=1 Tax=Microthyrium microscopicum TaxID=703497 RepID=A0A6A6UUB6_9PEZI|nr:hypothetical protein BT63DRAFT_450023 [Microthyrium microscopicum]
MIRTCRTCLAQLSVRPRLSPVACTPFNRHVLVAFKSTTPNRKPPPVQSKPKRATAPKDDAGNPDKVLPWTSENPETPEALTWARNPVNVNSNNPKVIQNVQRILSACIQSPNSKLRRETTFTIIQSILRVQGDQGQWNIPLAQSALRELGSLAEKNDLQAMAYKAFVLSSVPPTNATMGEADILWPEIILMVGNGTWKANKDAHALPGLESQLPSIGDIYYFHGLHQRNKDDEDGAKKAWLEATLQHQHAGAVSKLLECMEFTDEHFLEVHLLAGCNMNIQEVGKRLGDLCALDDETFSKLSASTRDYIETPGKCDPLAGLPDFHIVWPRHTWKSFYHPYPLKGPDVLKDESLRITKAEVLTTQDSISQSTLDWENRTHKEYEGERKTRYYKALDWYEITGHVDPGNVPVHMAGLKLAIRMGLPWEAICFAHELVECKNGRNEANKKYPLELLDFKNIAFSPELTALLEAIQKTGGPDFWKTEWPRLRTYRNHTIE